MTIMITQPDDNEFEALLQDYSAPVEDDGFADSFAQNIQAYEARLMRLRFMFLAVACTLGGVIAGTQFKSFMKLLGTYNIQAWSLWGLASFMVFAFVVWATLDNRDAGLV